MSIPLARLVPYAADRVLMSPNEGARKDGATAIAGVVLHATADNGSEAGAESWMRDPAAQASAHLHIRRDGSVTRLVDDKRRAWHAGVSQWRGWTDVNSHTLGWEIANRNDGREPYTDAQYATLARLAAHYLAQGLTRADFVSHAEIAPGRKTDPLGFDWARLWREVDVLDAPPALPNVTPHVVGGTPAPPPALRLEPITVPTPEHMEQAVRLLGLDERVVCQGGAALLAVLRAMAPEGTTRQLIDMLDGYRKTRCAA